jgi:IclR family transcriptional regulator, KDG regulon repressor
MLVHNSELLNEDIMEPSEERALDEGKSSFRPVRSADRTIDLLELLASRTSGMTFNELITALDMPKSSLSGLLRTLMARGYVARTSDGRRFRLGLRIIELSASYLRDDTIIEDASHEMRRLAHVLGETAHVAVLDGAEVLYVAAEHSQHSKRFASPLGRRLPAYATAVGKSLLATLPDAEVERLLGTQLASLTPQTSTSLAELRRELAHIRRLGYAYDSEEFAAGLHCVAAPICDETGRGVASIAVSIPDARLDTVNIQRVPELVVAAAGRVSRTALPGAHAWKPGAVKIAWSMGELRVQAYQTVYRSVERLARSSGADVIWADARDNPKRQAADVASLLNLRPDVLIIHPAHTLLAEPLFTTAVQAGVPVIAFQRPVRSRDVDYFVGGETYQQGRMTAAFVTRKLAGRGAVAMIQGDPYNDNARNLAQGVYDELQHTPDIRIVADQPAPFWSRQRAQQLAEAMLVEHRGALDAFIVANDDMAGGVAAAMAIWTRSNGCARERNTARHFKTGSR